MKSLMFDHISGLHSAVEGDQVEVVKLLFEAGADVNATNRLILMPQIIPMTEHIPSPNNPSFPSRYGFTPLDLGQTLGNCVSILPLLTPSTGVFHLPE